MPNLPSAFNAATSQPMDEYSAVPAGKYIAQIVKSERVKNKSNDNYRYQLSFKILNTEHSGRLIFVSLHLEAENPVAREISTKELTSICLAVKKPNATTTEELHGIPMEIKVAVKSDPKWGDQNVIKKYTEIQNGPVQQVDTPAPKKNPWD